MKVRIALLTAALFAALLPATAAVASDTGDSAPSAQEAAASVSADTTQTPAEKAPAKQSPGRSTNTEDATPHGTTPSEVVDSASPDKGLGEQAVAERDAVESCSLSDSGLSSHNEFATCVNITATLDGAPALGETATLTVEAKSQFDRPGGEISLSLPAHLELAGKVKGEQLSGLSANDGTQTLELATATAFEADETIVRTYVVRATAAGEGLIEVRVTAERPDGNLDGAITVVPVTVGEGNQPSALTISNATQGEVALVENAPAAPEFTADRAVDLEAVTVNDDATSAAPQAAAAPLQSCISGRWGFQHPSNGYTGVGNYQVQVWDQDNVSADDLLVTGVTSGNGNYNLCYTATDGEGNPAQEVYVRFISSNSQWRVRNTAAANNNYVNVTGVVAVAPGASHGFGSLQPGNNVHRALHAFNAVNKFWLWGAGNNGCFDHTGPCRRLTINWTNTSTDGTYYSGIGNDVHLAAADPDSEHLVIHEAAHAVMDDVYNDAYPATPSCNPHFVQATSSAGCAWSEGFAEWVPAAVLNDPRFVWASGASIDLENRSWTSGGWDDGQDVEGRVAGAMIDVSDFTAASRDYWDIFGEGDPSNQWRTFQDWELVGSGSVPQTYAQFWTDRAQKGFNTDDDGAGSNNYQNTIDYSFRDTLNLYVARTRPDPTDGNGAGHNYRVRNNNATNGSYWTAVAIRPEAGSDRDLRYYEDFGQGTNLATSSLSGSTIDFVAVDQNHRVASWDYPRVTDYSGGGEYDIEWAAGKQILTPGTTTVFMGSGDVVLVRDIFVSQWGNPITIRAIPAAGQDIELRLMDSDPTNQVTHVRTRSQAVRSADSGLAGVTETIAGYQPAVSDYHGLVILNKGGSGLITLIVDGTAPFGTAVINNGDTHALSPNVVLNSAMFDNESGIVDMRVSTDGVFDTEPWVPYQANRAVTLPGPDGTKTVLAQYRNGADLVANRVDSIQLYTGPLCFGLVPTIVGTPGPDSLTGTAGNDVILAGAGDDIIRGLTGNDAICAGAGNDIIDPGAGNDQVSGGPRGESDTVDYGSAAAGVTVDLAAGTATGGGNDTLQSIENVNGSAFDDVLVGNGLSNTFNGRAGSDAIDGAGGDDHLRGSADNDRLIGGTGTDLVDYSAAAVGVSVDLASGMASGMGDDGLASVENVTGSSHGDKLIGDGNANVLQGGAGADVIDGAAGNDTLLGEAGNDELFGGDGDDELHGHGGQDLLDGGVGNDVLRGDGGKDSLIGRVGDDDIDGGGGKNDTVFFSASAAAVNVDLLAGTAIGDGTDTLAKVENVVGSAFDDTILGNQKANRLRGAAGADTISGRGGDDAVYGQGGSDTLRGQAGNDTCHGGGGSDSLGNNDGCEVVISIP